MAIETDIYKDGEYWVWVNDKALRNDMGQFAKSYNKTLIRLKDLSETSTVKVIKICDLCGVRLKDRQYKYILRSRKDGDGLDRCSECGRIKRTKTRINSVPFENSISFTYPELASQWHPTMNGDVKPHAVSRRSGMKFWWICNKCDSPYDMSPSNRAEGCGCPYCSGKKVNHTSCLWTVCPDVAKLLWDLENGYKYTAGTAKKVDFRCPECKSKVKNTRIVDATKKGISCPSCSDGISYPEKFMYNMLSQTGIDFEYQKSFEWSKMNGHKRYDFYINDLNCIIELHGLQHYTESFISIKGARSLAEEQENDKIKKELAMENGIDKYIVIDCSKSEFDFIKNNIQKSELCRMINMHDVDWLSCHKNACKSLVKLVCDLWNSDMKSTAEIKKYTGLSMPTIISYLKRGKVIGLCEYDPKK